MGARNAGCNFKVATASMTRTEKSYLKSCLPDYLVLTQHAIDQQNAKHFHCSSSELFSYMAIENCLELQVKNNGSVLALFRCNVNVLYDICFVVCLNNHKVVTNWLNSVNDNHSTLKDTHLYTQVNVKELLAH